jgi:ketosteroid isomerase-like protein
MPDIDPDRVAAFFERYASALSSNDLDTLAACYAYPSIVVTGDASLVIDSPKQVVAAFRAERRADDVVTATAQLRPLESPAGNLAWVAVRWSYTARGGAEVSADAYRYLVRDAEGEVRICAVTPVPSEWGA